MKKTLDVMFHLKKSKDDRFRDFPFQKRRTKTARPSAQPTRPECVRHLSCTIHRTPLVAALVPRCVSAGAGAPVVRKYVCRCASATAAKRCARTAYWLRCRCRAAPPGMPCTWSRPRPRHPPGGPPCPRSAGSIQRAPGGGRLAVLSGCQARRKEGG